MESQQQKPACGRHFIFTVLALSCLLILLIHTSSATQTSFDDSLLVTQNSGIDSEMFGASEYCGLCHTDIYQQWNASSHHFSSFNNPIYRKVAINTLRQKGTAALQFCSGCHDPLVPPERIATLKDTDTQAFVSWEFNAGITCLSCHRIVAIGDADGNFANGSFRLEEPTLHPFALSQDPKLQETHKLLLQLTPFLHTAVVDKPFYASSEYCASCHTLTVPAAINGAHAVEIFDEYGQWRSSPQSKRGQGCIDCHMREQPSNDPAAKDGRIKSHSFAAGHTALAVFNRDFPHLQQAQAFLTDSLELSAVGIRIRNDSKFVDLDEIDLRAGDRAELALAVSNTSVGHNFPAGTADSNQAWLRLIMRDAQGNVLQSDGELNQQGQLPPDAIRFGVTFADKNGNPTNRGNTTTEAIYTAQNSVIAAGDSIMVHWPFTVPADVLAPLTLEITLNWRKYSPEFIDWVFDGRPVPDLPVTPIAQLTLTLPVGPMRAEKNTFLSTQAKVTATGEIK